MKKALKKMSLKKMPLGKMTKEDKMACANHKILKGFAIALFGLIWMYFGGTLEGLAQTFTVMGLLLLLWGLVKRFSI